MNEDENESEETKSGNVSDDTGSNIDESDVSFTNSVTAPQHKYILDLILGQWKEHEPSACSFLQPAQKLLANHCTIKDPLHARPWHDVSTVVARIIVLRLP